MKQLLDLVSVLSRDPLQHAKFINTLSLLEYIGARKIFKSQDEKSLTAEILGHAAEEIRHAQTLKRIALKMSSGQLETYSDEDLLCGKEARIYIQSIDYGVEKILGHKPETGINYLLTTLLLEERANQVYPFYENVLAKAGFPGVLKAIVREEDNHLKAVVNGLKDASGLTSEDLAQLRAMEEREFTKFLESILNTLQTAALCQAHLKSNESQIVVQSVR